MKILAPFSLGLRFGYSFGYSRSALVLVTKFGVVSLRAVRHFQLLSRKRVSTSVIALFRPCHSWHGCAGDRRGRSPTGG